MKSNIRLFADDTSIYLKIDDPTVGATVLNGDLERINQWAKTWLVTFNPQKTETLALTTKKNPPLPTLSLDNTPIQEVFEHRHLGLTFQMNCKWDKHILGIITKTSRLVNCLRSLKYRLSRSSLRTIYTAFILPHFDYCDIIWDGCTAELTKNLEELQLDALRSICGAVRGTSHSLLYNETCFIPLKERRRRHKLKLIFKIKNDMTPAYLQQHFSKTQTNYQLRNELEFDEYKFRTNIFGNSFIPSAIREWNKLDASIRNSQSISSFNSALNSQDQSDPVYYSFGTRTNQIIHCRLRLSCSDLNEHKVKRHIYDSPICACGHAIEDTHHFLLNCSLHSDARNQSISVLPIHYQNVNILLYGIPNDIVTSRRIFKYVHIFFDISRRFRL